MSSSIGRAELMLNTTTAYLSCSMEGGCTMNGVVGAWVRVAVSFFFLLFSGRVLVKGRAAEIKAFMLGTL